MSESPLSQPQSSSKQYGLAIHTSSPELGLAIGNLSGDRRTQSWALGREVSNLLHQYLAEFLAPQTWQDLGFLAVAKGPGSFTGTRIGVVTARTLAQQLNIPLFGISSLAAIVQAHLSPDPESANGQIFTIELPAQRGELHTAIYQATATGLIVISPETVQSPSAWQDRLDRLQQSYQRLGAPTNQGGYAAQVLELAAQAWQAGATPHWSEVLPIYGQHPVDR